MLHGAIRFLYALHTMHSNKNINNNNNNNNNNINNNNNNIYKYICMCKYARVSVDWLALNIFHASISYKSYLNIRVYT